MARHRDSFARCRTSSRSARTGAGASRSSFFTRRWVNPLIPNGCAGCTCAPNCCNVSTAQYQP
jgi:hypothetical protein